MVTFKSIVVLDTETTSLPALDHNTTKIVELAAVGCETDEIKNTNDLPRVIHKLVLLFNPLKPIAQEASKVSGLDNEMVQNLKPLEEKDAEVLEHFIRRLPQPVCIVAQNGNKFDFPILRKALQRINRNLPDDVYCADSVVAFRELLPPAENMMKVRAAKQRRLNETTPPQQKTQPKNTLNYKTSTCRELFPEVKTEPVGDSEFSDEYPNHQEMTEWVSNDEYLKRPKTCKLKDIYNYFFGEDFANSHRAEDDSVALLRCITKCQEFLNWMEANAVTFNSIPPLC